MSEQTPKKPRRRKWLRRIGWSILILMVALLAIRLVSGVVLQRRYNAKLEELRQAGEPLRLAEMVGPEVPASENAAMFYEPALDMMAFMGETEKGIDALTGKSRDWKKGLTANESAEAHRLLDEAGDVLRLLRKGGERPKCKLPEGYDLSAVDVWDSAGEKRIGVDVGSLVYRLSRIQSGARLLKFSAQVNLAEGKPDDAAADCVQIIKLTRCLDSTPCLISKFVDIACEGMAMRQLAQVLDASEPSADALREASAALGDLEDRTGFVRAFRGERCVGLEIYSSMLGDPIGRPAPPGVHAFGWTGRPMVLHWTLRYLDMMGWAVDLAGSPRWKPGSNWSRADAELRRMETDANWLNPFVGLMMPAVRMGAQSFDAYVARKADAKLAIALRLYRMKNGSYPAALDALVPGFLDTLPTDPFSGKSFVYRREGSGFIVYSVGANGKDDGGIQDPPNGDVPDIVLRVSR